MLIGQLVYTIYSKQLTCILYTYIEHAYNYSMTVYNITYCLTCVFFMTGAHPFWTNITPHSIWPIPPGLQDDLGLEATVLHFLSQGLRCGRLGRATDHGLAAEQAHLETNWDIWMSCRMSWHSNMSHIQHVTYGNNVDFLIRLLIWLCYANICGIQIIHNCHRINILNFKRDGRGLSIVDLLCAHQMLEVCWQAAALLHCIHKV